MANEMTGWMIAHEPALRFGCFATVFALMAMWEILAARRERRQALHLRWFTNLGMVVVDSFLVRMVFPAASVGVAILAEHEGWGLLNHFDVRYPVAFISSVLLLDLAIYLQHVMFHAVPVLWKIHMVHHSDQDLDVTSAIRFHPIEILLSVVFKFAVVAALGPPPAAVFVFAVLLNATAMFNHANVRLPIRLDGVLRLIVVTPDMHRVHHSVEMDETNSNFGFNLPWWDRLFGTYRAQPRAGHEEMELGVRYLNQPEPRGLLNCLILPFRRKSDKP